MNERQHEIRGEDARRILESPIYREAIAAIEARIVSELAQQETTPQRAEFLRLLLVAGRKHHTYIEQVLVTGTLSAMDAERKRTFKDRMLRRS